MKAIAWLEIELAHYDIVVQYVSHFTMLVTIQVDGNLTYATNPGQSVTN